MIIYFLFDSSEGIYMLLLESVFCESSSVCRELLPIDIVSTTLNLVLVANWAKLNTFFYFESFDDPIKLTCELYPSKVFSFWSIVIELWSTSRNAIAD